MHQPWLNILLTLVSAADTKVLLYGLLPVFPRVSCCLPYLYLAFHVFPYLYSSCLIHHDFLFLSYNLMFYAPCIKVNPNRDQ